MNKIYASTWRNNYLMHPELDYEITKESAKKFYFESNCILIFDEIKYYQNNFSIEELVKWNNEFIESHLDKCFDLLNESNLTISDLRNICVEYVNCIRNVFTNNKELLRKEYEFLLVLFEKYGYSPLYEISDLENGERSEFEYFMPLWNIEHIKPIFSDKYNFKDKNGYFYYGLLPFAYYLNDYDLIDKVVKNIIYPAIEHFLEPSDYMKKENKHYSLPPHSISSVKDVFDTLGIKYIFDEDKIKNEKYFIDKCNEYRDKYLLK